MADFSVLHLSDLHIASEADRSRVDGVKAKQVAKQPSYCSKAARGLALFVEKLDNLDVVVVSGDLAGRAQN
jgi:3',5'-cyclic AMP phosphodiesterase CpdA